jgi:hypothetical protein
MTDLPFGTLGGWNEDYSVYTITIRDLFNGTYAGVRDDTIANIKKKKGKLKVINNQKVILFLDYNEIDSNIAFIGKRECQSKFGVPWHYVYFYIKKEKEKGFFDEDN